MGKIPHLGGPQGNKANWMGECTLVWGQRRLWCWKSPFLRGFGFPTLPFLVASSGSSGSDHGRGHSEVLGEDGEGG